MSTGIVPCASSGWLAGKLAQKLAEPEEHRNPMYIGTPENEPALSLRWMLRSPASRAWRGADEATPAAEARA
ncbi:MAG: hypothetical protein KF729_20975 [Sandaracinaceae bacterium]|nr:hypothetical protein [Sandaracinaceae bacterium]